MLQRLYASDLYGLLTGMRRSSFTFTLWAAELVSAHGTSYFRKPLIFMQVHAVSVFHNMGYIHLDLKPSNILISPRGHLVLGDFGLACRISPENPVASGGRGTTGYEAPEVIADNLFGTKGFDQRADVWSVGIILVQMFNHLLPSLHQTKRADPVVMDLRTLKDDPATFDDMIYIRNHEPRLYALLYKARVFPTCRICCEPLTPPLDAPPRSSRTSDYPRCQV